MSGKQIDEPEASGSTVSVGMAPSAIRRRRPDRGGAACDRRLAVNDEMLRPFLEGQSLDQTLASKKLFIVDLELLDGVEAVEGTEVSQWAGSQEGQVSGLDPERDRSVGWIPGGTGQWAGPREGRISVLDTGRDRSVG